MSDEMQFIDTNVLVYAHDVSAGHKHTVAQNLVKDLWESRRGCISIQVLQEFFVTVTRKVASLVSEEKATSIVSELSNWQVFSPGTADLLHAIAFQRQYQISFWDAMIVQSAVKFGCSTLWSEDLNAGQVYEGVTVRNPFELTMG